MMDIAADQRQDEVFSAKFGIVLESHFDEVTANYEGQPGYFMVNHPDKGRIIIDSINKQVVHSDDPDLSNLAIELLAHLQEAAHPYTVSQI